MNRKDLFEIFGIDDLIHLPEAVMKVLDAPLEERNAVYMQMLERSGFDLSYDWFEKVYMAGTGGLVIKLWHLQTRKCMPWEYFPSEHMVNCWELSDRCVPLLLLNLSIRGMMGYVYHGDTLERTVKMKYVLLNTRDDCMGFSEVIRDPDGNKLISKETRL